METIQFTRQYRYIDPDRAIAEENGALLKNGKVKFNWDMTEVEEATDKESGDIEVREYIITCKASNAVKALVVAEVDLVTTEEEADSRYFELSGDEKVAFIRYADENRAKDEASAGLMDRHESPEKAAKRQEKKQAKAAQETMDWMKDEVKAGRYPSQEAFNDKVREVHTRLNIPLPETD
ncbi:MAG: hypothetical protein ACXADL_13950 [Candidatus Thorarchaeota archaeon]|jgi:hypothetical protein